MSASSVTANITANTNTVSIPATIFIPDLVYYTYSSGTVQRLMTKDIKGLIDLEGPNRFFNTTNTGDPDYYTVRGTSLLFNKYFSRTATAAINIYGLGFPTTLSSGSDITELPTDYDLLIVYESAVLYYQKDDDQQNQVKFQQLAQLERVNLKHNLDTDDESTIRMDPNVFTGRNGLDITNPNVLFTS
jgi:hypothetical protein